MGKQEWLRHADEAGIKAMPSKADKLAHVESCRACKARRRTMRANRSARERNEALRSLGMVQTPYGWE